MENGKLIGQGRTAEVFECGQDKILKLFREDMPKNMVEKEYEFSTNICKVIKCVPKVYTFIEVDDRFGIIYERINGKTMMKVIASKPWRVKKEAQCLAELHKAIQQKVDFELYDCKASLKYNISKTELLDDNVKTRLYEYIDKLEDNNILCHGDFHPENVLITDNGLVVIDWMTAARGNPLFDVARTSVILKFGGVPEKSYLERKIINYGRYKFYSEYIKQYIKITGIQLEKIEQWELPVAAARLVEWLPKEEKTELLNFINKKFLTLNL